MDRLPRTLEPEVMESAEEAAEYDAMDHRVVNSIFVKDFLNALYAVELNDQRPRIVDLGTGTGLIPVELLRQSSTPEAITACDLSHEMLKVAWRHIQRRHLSKSIQPVLADATRLPIADHSCHAVMSNSLIHHLPEPLGAFQECRRILRPGGLLFMRDLLRPETSEDVEMIVKTHAGSETEYQQQLFRQSLHAALTLDEVRQLLVRADYAADSVSRTSDRHWTVQTCQ